MKRFAGKRLFVRKLVISVPTGCLLILLLRGVVPPERFFARVLVLFVFRPRELQVIRNVEQLVAREIVMNRGAVHLGGGGLFERAPLFDFGLGGYYGRVVRGVLLSVPLLRFSRLDVDWDLGVFAHLLITAYTFSRSACVAG